jgi:hypothetical protein
VTPPAKGLLINSGDRTGIYHYVQKAINGSASSMIIIWNHTLMKLFHPFRALEAGRARIVLLRGRGPMGVQIIPCSERLRGVLL